MTKWNPDQYLRFRTERTQAATDLAAGIRLDDARSLLDVGCGPGNSTQVLRERWPAARIVGLDNSEEMIEKARAEYPGGEWVKADASSYRPDQAFDVVFSNATLHWLPDHERLLPRLYGFVAARGALAVQVPANHESPLARSLAAVAASDRWRAMTGDCSGLTTYRSASDYYDILARLTGDLRIWETTYYHRLDSDQGLIDWYRSTGMRPYLERLPGAEARKAFEDEVLAGCREAYPVRADGKLLFPFRRLFFVAYR